MMTEPESTAPIGVFDSGVGGLSVLRHIRQQLSAESLIYVADTGHLPYGPQPEPAIIQRSLAISGFLLARGAKAIVVACNTATAAAVVELRRHCAVPVIGVEPGIKPALERSRGGVIGVLATAGTLGSDRFRQLVGRYGSARRVIIQPCPGWVELVEQGAVDDPLTRQRIAAVVGPLLAQGVDTLVLGCTHYPFLAPIIRRMVGPDVQLVDTGPAIARELRRRLADRQLLATEGIAGPAPEFWVSGDPQAFTRQLARLWQSGCRVSRLPPQAGAMTCRLAEASVVHDSTTPAR